LLSDSVNFCFTQVWLALKYCMLICWQCSRPKVLRMKYSDRIDWLSVACVPRMSVCLFWIVIIIVYIFVLPTLIWWIKVVYYYVRCTHLPPHLIYITHYRAKHRCSKLLHYAAITCIRWLIFASSIRHRMQRGSILLRY